MGKKAKLKMIRRLASSLPVMETARTVTEKATGAQLLTHGVKKVEGQKVDENAIYTVKRKVAAPVNHNKKMKRLYNRFGAIGVGLYVNGVRNLNQNTTAK